MATISNRGATAPNTRTICAVEACHTISKLHALMKKKTIVCYVPVKNRCALSVKPLDDVVEPT